MPTTYAHNCDKLKNQQTQNTGKAIRCARLIGHKIGTKSCNETLSKPTISTQVINECSHGLLRKRQYSPDDVNRELSAIIKAVTLVDVGIHEIRQAWKIAARYRFSHYDSLIIAAALASDCSTLYSNHLDSY